VSDIVAEIASASGEQSAGIEQVNRAIADMDSSTQHNAALVEESAAAATALSEQADKLAEVVSLFHIGTEAPAPAPKAGPKAASKAAPKAIAKAVPARAVVAVAPRASAAKPAPKAVAVGEEWETF
jgi:methyl-accepting chemotaxis protein